MICVLIFGGATVVAELALFKLTCKLIACISNLYPLGHSSSVDDYLIYCSSTNCACNKSPHFIVGVIF